VLVLGVLLAVVVVPSLLRSRVQHPEAPAIGDTRTIISAQAAYQSLNRGFFEGRLDCLAQPGRCLPGYTGPQMLDEALASQRTKSGYLREFVAGPAVDRAKLAASEAPLSPSSVTAWAYRSWPERPGDTGARGFCGDSTGIVCATTAGREPDVKDGSCDLQTCAVLQ
jgi:hypothetical protein